jgi:hypothetical protein
MWIGRVTLQVDTVDYEQTSDNGAQRLLVNYD